MGIYRRPDSPFYWLLLEQRGGKPRREGTLIRVTTGDTATDKANLKLAEQAYHARMAALAHERTAGIIREPRKTRIERWSYVYFIANGSEVKIGRAINVSRRLRELQVASVTKLRILAAVPAHPGLERDIHRAFARFRKIGEWYALKDDLARFVGQVAAGMHPVALLDDRYNHATKQSHQIG